MWSWVKSALGYGDLEEQKGADVTATELTEDKEAKKGLWNLLSNSIGQDVTRGLSLPVWLFEPTTFLQLQAEPLQYSYLLTQAAKTEDSVLRLALVAAYATTMWHLGTRTKKPFNPLLGETYELAPHNCEWKMIAEQVSHHPPIGVSITKGSQWELNIENAVSTKFKGNSVEAYSTGSNHFFSTTFNDHITWGHLTSCAHNIFIGKTWIDHYGTLIFKNHTTGQRCELHFTQCGWTGAGQYEVKGDIFDRHNQLLAKIKGAWNSQLKIKYVNDKKNSKSKIDTSSNSSDNNNNTNNNDNNNNNKENQTLWKRSTEHDSFKASHPFRYTPFLVDTINGLNEEYEEVLPASDSRKREDRKALEKGDLTLAEQKKRDLEILQRHHRKKRADLNQSYSPRYFKLVDDETSETGKRWKYIGNYWEERDARIASLPHTKKLSVAKLSQVSLDLLNPSTTVDNDNDNAKVIKNNNNNNNNETDISNDSNTNNESNMLKLESV